ncbi:uncharacterized protein LOC119178120 isoform X3 [Rhipicephalus microplus]|uniref:uncharacterized protein LOC119178120 isoform X3 n=1 Tax=Rhipicephalus microplus TaxID=6941 RepID=UPI003F6D16AC
MFARSVFAGLFISLSLYRPASARDADEVQRVQAVIRFAQCRASCLDKCWDVCRFFNDDFEVWRHMCAVEELCFPGCRQACSFWYKASPKQLGNPLMSVSDVFAGMFFEPARLEGHGPHNVRITWSRPESTMDDNIERALVYVIFLRGLFDDQRWEDVAQTQYLNATVRRSQLKQASEVKVIALSPYGVFAHTQVGLDLDLAAYDSLQADDSITSALPIFAAPNVVEIKHSSGYRVEVDIAWEFGLSLQAKDVKYEVTWIIPDRAADVSGRMYTSQQSATLQLWEGTSYSIFVRRLSPVTGKPDAETLSRYLNTPVVEPKQSTQHAASTDTCVRLEVVVACAALATAIVFVSVASLAVSLMRKSDRSKREHPASAESASSEKSVLGMCLGVMATEQARSGRMPVVVCPSQLDFYLDQQESHKQVLTLYNINDFSVRFQLLSNAPRRYAVAEPEGMLKPHSFTDVVVRHREAVEGNVGRRDHLRVIMYEEGGRLHGHRDVPATLRPPRGRGDEPCSTSSVPLEPSLGTERQPSRAAANGPSFAIVLVALVCLAALVLPLEGASGGSHPYLQLTHQQKLVAAYILGTHDASSPNCTSTDTQHVRALHSIVSSKPDSHRSFLGAFCCFSFKHSDVQRMSTLLWSLQRQWRAQTPQVFLWPDPLEASCNICIVNADLAYCFLIVLSKRACKKRGDGDKYAKTRVPPYKY